MMEYLYTIWQLKQQLHRRDFLFPLINKVYKVERTVLKDTVRSISFVDSINFVFLLFRFDALSSTSLPFQFSTALIELSELFKTLIFLSIRLN